MGKTFAAEANPFLSSITSHSYTHVTHDSIALLYQIAFHVLHKEILSFETLLIRLRSLAYHNPFR